jgi:hypothetical protein
MFCKQDVLSPYIFNFAVEYADGKVNHEGLKLNGTHQLQFHPDDVNILYVSAHTIKKKRCFSSS